MTIRNPLRTAVFSLALIVLSGCSTVTKIGTQIGQGSGVISEEQATSINKTSAALEKTFADITPEQEYYIGRAVAATILQTYPPLDDPDANHYLNELGQTMAMASDRPETFGGYHFLLLDSDQINAFAAPGGLILVCKGLVSCCRNEDELAAVLAHEIGHVQDKDGLRAIKKSRLTSALTTIGVEAGRNLGGDKVKELTEQFAGGIQDIIHTLVTSGYARGQEYQADAVSAEILRRVGYDPGALVSMLEEMNRRWNPHGPGFARTHPAPRDRIEHVKPLAGTVTDDASRRITQQRFTAAMSGI